MPSPAPWQVIFQHVSVYFWWKETHHFPERLFYVCWPLSFRWVFIIFILKPAKILFLLIILILYFEVTHTKWIIFYTNTPLNSWKQSSCSSGWCFNYYNNSSSDEVSGVFSFGRNDLTQNPKCEQIDLCLGMNGMEWTQWNTEISKYFNSHYLYLSNHCIRYIKHLIMLTIVYFKTLDKLPLK